ncbi:MAG: CotH kinase family protein [Myxococcota bacterium]
MIAVFFHVGCTSQGGEDVPGHTGPEPRDARVESPPEPDVGEPTGDASDGSPTFGVERGFFDAPFQVELTAAGDEPVYYTTDGSTPTPETGIPYVEPILVERTTPLRAVAVSPEGELSPVVTHTYVFPADVVLQPEEPDGYPSIFARNEDGFGPYPADYEMDPDVVGDPRYAGEVEAALLELPTVSIVTDVPHLFDDETGIYLNPWMTGDDWERPASVELVDPEAGTLFATQAGVRIHGNASRKPSWTPKRGFRTYFRSRYGLDRIELPLFDDPEAVTSFDTLVLRSIPNYAWTSWNEYQRRGALYMRDEFARRTQLEMGHLTAHGRFVHTYVNGLFWGIYNLTERIDDDFLVDYLGGEDVGWDLVSMTVGVLEADEGDLVAYDEMMALANAGVATDEAYAALREKLDVVNLIDYLLVTHWVQNSDWPKRNWFAARKRDEGERFIFLAWDSDTSLSTVDMDVVSQDLDGSPQRLFHKLRENAEFRMLYADRIQLHLLDDGVLSAANATARFRELVDPLELAVTAESARWGDYVRDVYQTPEPGKEAGLLELYTPDDHWTPARDKMLAVYFPERTDVLVEQYRALGLYPDVEPARFGTRGGDVPEGFVLTLDNTPNAGRGTVWYRLDGGDPREPGGAISDHAIRGDDLARIPLVGTTRVRARVHLDGAWSAVREGVFETHGGER